MHRTEMRLSSENLSMVTCRVAFYCFTALLTVPLYLAMNLSAAAEDISQPGWGKITPIVNHPDTYGIEVQKLPSSGKVSYLPGQQILRCMTLEEEPRQVEIEADPKTGTNSLLLPEHLESRLKLRALVGNETGQSAYGRWIFSATDANVQGTHAKLESQPGNHRIGFWTSAEDAVHWKFKATRWGMYRATLVYANASPAGSEVTVQIGEETVQVKLNSTGSWYRYRSQDLGQVYLPTAGEKTIEVRCTKLVGSAVMNLKAIILEPGFEGQLPVQGEDGSITLYCGSARIDGTVLRYEPAEHKRTIGFWTLERDTATWRFEVKQPQKLEVEVWQGCGKGQGGSEMMIRLGDQEIPFNVEETGHFQNFKPRIIGHLVIDQPGEYELSVSPVRIAKAAACDIRQIRLLPVSEVDEKK